MRLRPAFTIIEVLLTIAVFIIVVSFVYYSYLKSQSNQALVASTEQLANVLRSAHIFAREAKDKRGWGVRRDSSVSYSLVSVGATTRQEKNYFLESTVEIPDDFFVRFEIGSGEASANTSIFVKNRYGRIMRVDVLKSGVVEVAIVN